MAGEVTQNPNSPCSTTAIPPQYFGPSWQTVKLWRSSTLWSRSTPPSTTPDQCFTGPQTPGRALAHSPPRKDRSGHAPLAGLLSAGMANLVSSGKDAWCVSSSGTKNLQWLSLVNPTDVANLKTALSTYASSSYVPPEFAWLQSLTGTTCSERGSGSCRLQRGGHVHRQVRDGHNRQWAVHPHQYSASTSPAFTVLTKNPAFTWGNQMSPQLGQTPVLLSQEAQIPPVVSPGQTITVTALQTVEGSSTTSPAPGATVTLQLIANGRVAFQSNYTASSAGIVSATIPTTLSPGTYVLSIYTATAGSTLYNPLTETIQLSAATTTTTTSTTSSASSTTTTTTSSTSSSTSLSPTVLGGVAIVAVMVASAIALGSNRRRGYNSGPSI